MEEYLVETDGELYIISDRKGTFIKRLIAYGEYEFTTKRADAALFDRLYAITQPIVRADKPGTPFYFDPA